MVRRVAGAIASGIVSVALLVSGGVAAIAQEVTPPAWTDSFRTAALSEVPKQLSSDCKVKAPAFEGKAPLKKLRRALIERRPVRVLAIGSSSTAGVGASSPRFSYPVRLENDLEGFIKGADVEMITRGIGGEIAAAAAERLKLEVADQRPDLVVWQVGTNDAMARVDDDDFKDLLRSTLKWLKKAKVDVVLIDPQYTQRLASDDHYRAIVSGIADVAREEKVLLVHRFDAMSDLAQRNGEKTYIVGDGLHLNDLGYRCMAEYAARAIVAGILADEPEPATPAAASPQN